MFEMSSTYGIQKKGADVMTLPELNKNLDKTVKDITGSFQLAMMVDIGVRAKQLIFDRVHGTGVDAKGNKYAPYSTKPTLVGNKTFAFQYASQALLGSKSKRKELEWRTVNGKHLAILPGGYAKIRQLQRRQTAFVDFSVTQEMWKDINVIKSTNNSVTIGAKDDINKKKLSGNTKRRTDILDLSQKEIDELKKAYGLSILNIFKENGL